MPSPESISKQFKAPLVIFWTALIVRIAYVTIAHTYHIRTFQDHFQFGWEMGRIARALATGYGYSDPFVGHTGPTAWVPPLYPLLLAGVFKIFGVYSAASAWVILALNSVFSAATALFVYEIGARCYNQRVAKWSGWLWALYPAAMQYAVHWVWEMSLTAMLFTWVLVLALRMRGIGGDEPKQTAGRWVLFGALWGMIALSNATVLLFLPVCGIWILLGARQPGRAISQAALAGVVFLAFLTPWIVRNWQVFHVFVPIRGNMGAEMYVGNGPGSNGFAFMATLPLVERDPETIRYRTLGEVEYVREQGEKADAYLKTHHRHFAEISLKRFYFYWASVPHPVEHSALAEFGRELSFCFVSITGVLGLLLSLKNRIPASGLFAWAFLLLPLTYYFVTVAARFRHPLEPLIAIFSVYLFQSARPRRQKPLA
ncbi:glycosyltransferase family 39 protein [Silvibacterium acidisoli]|uniref:glycosyltransferase family 39 protein n=1 Tax=Acidobacteriaceae bacterium ZG23-2 TaxID=2883246 RepID=UPI00406BF4FC